MLLLSGLVIVFCERREGKLVLDLNGADWGDRAGLQVSASDTPYQAVGARRTLAGESEHYTTVHIHTYTY